MKRISALLFLFLTFSCGSAEHVEQSRFPGLPGIIEVRKATNRGGLDSNEVSVYYKINGESQLFYEGTLGIFDLVFKKESLLIIKNCGGETHRINEFTSRPVYEEGVVLVSPQVVTGPGLYAEGQEVCKNKEGL